MDNVADDVDPEDVAIASVPEGVVPGLALNVPVTSVGPVNDSVTGEAKLACEPTNTVTVPVEP
jgi:hypothetical protein